MSPGDLAVYISADMEGVAGVTGPDQLRPTGFEYQSFRKTFTAEVVAAIEGAREAGAMKIVVSDSHGNGLNLIPAMLPKDIELVRSWPRPLGMMQGIDDSFDAALLIGYHSSAGRGAGIAAHTFSSALLSSVRIDGTEMGEAGVNALIAGHFGVPVVMISGDDVAVAEAQELLGPIEGAVVKQHVSHGSTRTLMPEAAIALIREKASAGISRRGELQPCRPANPLTLELTYKHAQNAELISYLAGIHRSGSHTVRFEGSILEASGFIEVACAYPAHTG